MNQTQTLSRTTAKQFFNENGYYVARSLVPQNSVQNTLTEAHQLFASILKQHGKKIKGCATQADMLADMKAVFDIDIKGYLNTLRLAAKLNSIHRLISEPEVMLAAKEIGIELPIIPAEPYMVVMSEELKIPGGYFGVGAHQDWPSMQGSLQGVVLWTPLIDVEEDTYPLEIIPGSHKQGLWEGKITEHCFELDKSLYKDEDFIPVPVKQGDMIFFSLFTVHRSGLKGRKGALRLGCSTRYENALEQTFVERGYPTAYQRSVNREFITPDFPSAEQVRAIFSE